ncbi:hypothetical protein A1D22_06030 [Pasteurellaceae bacterium LFhippo2]|nr:hypothetical protein [Pasteurellaceae bacterium LFhippo2]
MPPPLLVAFFIGDNKMNQLIEKIEQWAEDRNLINGSTLQKQMLKLMEEFGELCSGIAKNKPDVIKDSIGDCFVVMVILRKQANYQINIAEELIQTTQSKPISDMDRIMLTATGSVGRFAETVRNNIDGVCHRWIDKQYNDDCVLRFLQCLHAISFNLNLDFIDCIQHAYDQIKDRKGKMIDGIFVKEEDL